MLNPESLTLPRPDDWHLHLRDGAMMEAVLPYTARHFARALVMPNLVTPVVTAAQAQAYRSRILEAVPEGMSFTPLMTAYLTDHTDPADLIAGFQEKIFFAAKLYPANATTNAQSGVSDIQVIAPVLEQMQKAGMPLSIHGELAGADIDFFDREKLFIDQILIPLRRNFPELKIVLEHLTTRHAVQYVMAEAQNSPIVGTITAHHLWLNRNAMFEGGFNPHHFCLPIVKREEDRQALIEAATLGASMIFAGTDSAPHPRQRKECAHGAGGIFTAPLALSLYAEIFDSAGALACLEKFLCFNGASFYGLPVNAGKLTLERVSPATLSAITTKSGEEVVPFVPAGLSWRVRD
ncbi:MAG: dihydroorotase [Bdellovibrionales bacterium]